MIRPFSLLATLCAACGLPAVQVPAASPTPLAPFVPDANTLLLYHFDEPEGTLVKDSSGNALDGDARNTTRVPGRFGGALEFNGKDSCVFRQATSAIEKLRQLTVECWYRQDDPTGRQFLAGKDVTFHFDLGGGGGTSLSLYNQAALPADPPQRRHQQVSTSIGSPRLGRWHHLAATYDGTSVSFFLDGVLVKRAPGPKDFLLGGTSRGLWLGCYVGNDFWFSGRIDEFRVSDCVRYDPENRLVAGGRAFETPGKTVPPKVARKPRTTGKAILRLVLKRRYGGNAAGWVYLKSPGKPAVIVGSYDLKASQPSDDLPLEFDVSDEFDAPGRYLVGLENVQGEGYYSATQAALVCGGHSVARWSGDARSRRTFQPPILLPLDARGPRPVARPSRIVLLPAEIDRRSGSLEVDAEPGEPPRLFGQGMAEYWLDLPASQTYRVYLRYVTRAAQPCDLVIDGDDLHPYQMAARNRTDSHFARDALWEYQGTVRLAAGPHWVRLQDVLPEILALRLEPVADVAPAAVPWQRFAVPDGHCLGEAGPWRSEPLFGRPQEAAARVDTNSGESALRVAASFANTDRRELDAGDALRLVRSVAWDLEPFGRLTFRLQGQGTGHFVSLWAVDVKGDEKLLWRARDREAGTHEISVPISFEGNEVFDPGHVSAVCLELDEAGVQPEQVHKFSAAILNPVLHRRDALAASDDATSKATQTVSPVTAAPSSAATLLAPAFRPWTRPVVPEEYPEFARTEPKPVARKTLGFDLHLTGARSIQPKALDEFHKDYQFGDVCWPHIGICPQRNKFKEEAGYRDALKAFEDHLIGVRDRGLFLFDIWGYVPYHPDFPHTVAPEHHAILMRVFGDRFLGYDNGEQDGRYIGAYAGKGKHTNRREGWDDFVRWDEHVCGDSMNYMNATGSLNFSHYYAQRNCRMLGLETAQGLPSDTLLFAFLRGAARQYGRLTYQATSIWNRFGYNRYDDRKTTGQAGYGYGPHKGCSLSLHKRLFFAGYLGGQSIFGTESAQFTADRLENGARELSPLGRQHLELGQWAARHPDRGVPYAPVAFMLDFYNGWNMPRHLYRPDKYKIWGKFPYEKGDYLIDALFRMVWPGYEDASYLRNERGFLTPTPYGDLFEVVTNRCPAHVLKQYAAVMLLGDVELAPEHLARLVDYVRQGGDLLVDARHARKLPSDLTGVQFGDEAAATFRRDVPTGETVTEQPYHYTMLKLSGAAAVTVNEHGLPLLTVHRAGQGRVMVAAADYWMTDPLAYRDPEIVHMEPPYRLLRGVRAVLARYFASFNPVRVDPAGLAVMTCCYEGDPKHLRIGLLNNDLFSDWHGRLQLREGAIGSARELWKGAQLDVGPSLKLSIKAGDVAIVDLRLK